MIATTPGKELQPPDSAIATVPQNSADRANTQVSARTRDSPGDST